LSPMQHLMEFIHSQRPAMKSTVSNRSNFDLTDSRLSAFDEIVGLDLGHGDFCLYAVKVASTDAQCVEINQKKSQVTAVGFGPDGTIAVGQAAVLDPDCKELAIGFKRRPEVGSGHSRFLQSFFKEVIRKAVENGSIVCDVGTLLVVGCPSEWPREDDVCKQYRDLLQQSLDLTYTPQVIVVPESRAALLCAKRHGLITLGEIERGIVLTLDFGSSTLDVTLLRRGGDVPDDGADLGAFLLDELILLEALRTAEHCEEICIRCSTEPSVLWRCLLLCRELKEVYFGMDAQKRGKFWIAKGSVTFDREDGSYFEFNPKLRGDQILSLYMETRLERLRRGVREMNLPEHLLFFPQPEFEHLSYHEAICVYLRKVQRLFADKYPEESLNKVILTGGASRMDFVAIIVEKIFNDLKPVRQSGPETTVALGLTFRGRAEVVMASFRQAINVELPAKTKDILTPKLAALYYSLSQAIAKRFVADVVSPNLYIAFLQDKTWQDLDKLCKDDMEKWSKGTGAKDVSISVTEEWMKGQILSECNFEVAKIANRFGLSAIQLQLTTVPPINTSGICEKLLHLVSSEVVSNAMVVALGPLAALYATFVNLGRLWSEKRDAVARKTESRIYWAVYSALQADTSFELVVIAAINSALNEAIDRLAADETCVSL
jgi:hypothetical protein